MSTRHTKIRRDLRRNWGRAVLAVLSITIGVLAIGINSGMMDLMPARMLDSYQATNPAHVRIWLDGAVDDDQLARLAREPGLLGVEGQADLGGQWRLKSSQDWRDLSITVRSDYEQQQFNTLVLLSGAWPHKKTVAIEEASLAGFDIPADGAITMRVNGRDYNLKIGGVVRDIMGNPPAFGGNATIFLSPELAEDIWGMRGFTLLMAQLPDYTADKAQAAAEQLKGQLDKMGVPVVFYRTFDPGKHYLQDMVNGVIMITGVMGVLALGLGLFLVINTINAIVAQQIPQIGIMKAIGGTNRQMITLYLTSVLIYGLIALVIAVPLGALAADGVSDGLLTMMAIPVDPRVNISSAAVVQQVIVALLIPLLAALWPVYSGVRVTVREALSNYGIGAGYGRSLFDRALSRLRFLSRPLALTLRNTFRRKGRVILTQITLVMAGVVFIMVMSSAASFTYTINFLTESLGLKVLMYFQQPVRIEEVKPIIESQPDVELAEFTLFQTSSAYTDEKAAEGKDIFINAVLPDSQLLKLTVVSGRWLLPEDGHAVVMTTETAGKLGVQVGDPIYVKINGDKRAAFTVVGTVTDLSNMQRNIYIPLSVFQQEIGLTGRGTTAWVLTHPDDGATQLRVEKNLREALTARGLKVGGSQTAESIRVSNENTFGIITAMLLTMSALIAVVGAIGLGGTLSINVLERRREIGVMRAIGASSFQIALLFVGEGLTLGLLAWLIAIPLSIPVGQLFSLVIGQVINFGVIFQFSWAGAVQWLAIIVVLSILGSALPALRATRISIRESLAYE